MKSWHLVTSQAEVIMGSFYEEYLSAAFDYVELLKSKKNIPVYLTTVTCHKMPAVGAPLSHYL